ncbi:ImmA/IrrE family metallo-endopeptidase [Streptomyces roseifaciens]|uniref:ImmA/IrrE family metallo-endopeptidase n=1 Tax=Streptomyces roseifaciens TaxID=1488406 RepID=UPI001365B909|nr:ImmA/IrrE family metallo-endopeptidase [Streptomyces roseifaciens]
MGLDKDSRDIVSLRDRLSDQRGKPIHLIPMAIPEYSLNGMWMATPAADFVIYEVRTTRAHQEHIIAHELAHILCDHEANAGTSETVLSHLFPDIDPMVVRRALQRTEYSERNEQEAEMVASILLTPVRRQNDTGTEPPLCPDDEVITRLKEAISAGHSPSVGSVQ